jgi:hypothetical protein
VPSGKRSKQARRAAQLKTPPPVQSKGLLRRRRALTQGSRWWMAGGGAVVIALVVGAIALGAFGGAGRAAKAIPGLQTGAPPWNNSIGTLQDNLPLVHLDALRQEALAFHIHQHLDVYLNGKPLTVPAGIGIYPGAFITEVHTHLPDGVIHVESATQRDYTLGQFFGEWGVRVNANCLGRYCGAVHWWMDGKLQTGNPADLILRSHQEIVVAAGAPPAQIPAHYNFPAGE